MKYILLEINTDSDWDCLGYNRALIKYDANIDSTLKAIFIEILETNKHNGYVNSLLRSAIEEIDDYGAEISVSWGNYDLDTTLVETVQNEYGLQLKEAV